MAFRMSNIYFFMVEYKTTAIIEHGTTHFGFIPTISAMHVWISFFMNRVLFSRCAPLMFKVRSG